MPKSEASGNRCRDAAQATSADRPAQGPSAEAPQALAARLAAAGITPLAVQLATMRYLWDQATVEGRVVNGDKAQEAAALAKATAPYVHPRLSTVEAAGPEVGAAPEPPALDPALKDLIGKIARREP